MLLRKGIMEELKDRILPCRQCGKEFLFTVAEQKRYNEKGWSEPRHCPPCREARREAGKRLCAGCAAELDREGAVYCSQCLENIRRETEDGRREYEKKIAELESRLQEAGGAAQSLAAAKAELERSQQTSRELSDRVKALEAENSRLAEEKILWQNVEAVKRLDEQFEAFRRSYACDVDKLTGLLLEVNSQLAQQNGSLLHRLWSALKKTARTEPFPAPEGEAGVSEDAKAGEAGMSQSEAPVSKAESQ